MSIPIHISKEQGDYQFEKDVAASVQDKMREGEEYYPYSPANMQEALEQSMPRGEGLGWADSISLAAKAIERGGDPALVSEGAILNCMRISHGYWKELVEVKVREELNKFRKY